MRAEGNRLKSRTILIIRNVGYLIGLTLLIYQAYKGIIAVIDGKHVIPGLGISAIALSVSILAMACQITAWWLIMKGWKSKEIPLRESFWGYTLSFLPRYIPGTVWGYMSRGNWLKTEYSVDYKKSTLGSFTELALMVFVNIIISSSIFIHSINNQLVLFIILGCIFLILLLASLSKIRTILANLLINIDFVYLVVSFILLLCTWALYGYSLFLIAEPYNAIHLISYNRWFIYSGIYSSAWLAGFFVIFVPAGMGVRELALSHLLTSILNIDSLTSAGLAVFFRLIVSLSELSWLLIGLLVKKYANKPIG